MAQSITPCSLAKQYSSAPINLDDILLGKISMDNSLTDFGSEYKMKRNYFDCATYFFDGVFNVAKFAKGSVIYHGSSFLANSNVSFPVGKNFYMPVHENKYEISLDDAANSRDGIESLIKNVQIQPSWYSDYDTSKIYSAEVQDRQDPVRNHLVSICKDKCVFAYKLKEDIVMFLLDDDYNIAKLFATSSIPENIKDNLQKMFNLSSRVPIRQKNDNPFQRIRYDKDRQSFRSYDTNFVNWACPHLINKIGYAGICAMVQKSDFHGGQFHMEFIFCNPFKYLTRDLNNKYDWQYRNDDTIPVNLRNLLYGMKLYKSINVNFHAGNLYEHSIWTLLWSEYIFFQNLLNLNQDLLKLINERGLGLSALLHDIGKMTNTDEILFNNFLLDYVFFSVKDHPIIGATNILTNNIPQFEIEYDDMGFKESVTNIGHGGLDNILIELDMSTKYKYVISFVSEAHWYFGNDVLRLYNAGYNENDICYDYISKIYDIYNKKYQSTGIDFMTLFLYLVIVSLADIYAAQPYGVDRLLNLRGPADLNKKSRIFPFIHNVPKNYPGRDVYTDFKVDTNGRLLAHHAIMMLYKKYNKPAEQMDLS